MGGARVNFFKQQQSGADATVDDEDRPYPLGKFERYDTPHPRPMAPKNRAQSKSGEAGGENAEVS